MNKDKYFIEWTSQGGTRFKLTCGTVGLFIGLALLLGACYLILW